MIGIIIGFLLAILIVVVQIYLKIEGYNLDRAIDKLPKIKQRASIIRIKPKQDQKVEEIINKNEKEGKDTPLEQIL